MSATAHDHQWWHAYVHGLAGPAEMIDHDGPRAHMTAKKDPVGRIPQTRQTGSFNRRGKLRSRADKRGGLLGLGKISKQQA